CWCMRSYLCKKNDNERFSPPCHTKTKSWPMVSPNQGSRNIAVHLSEMKLGAEALKHIHETSEQVYIVLSGRATMTVGGQIFDAKKGDVVYIPANVEHEAKVVGRETFESMVVS